MISKDIDYKRETKKVKLPLLIIKIKMADLLPALKGRGLPFVLSSFLGRSFLIVNVYAQFKSVLLMGVSVRFNKLHAINGGWHLWIVAYRHAALNVVMMNLTWLRDAWRSALIHVYPNK
ncbi:MAG: hypothetical protein RXO22_05985 [Thermocladium sp.]